MGAAKSIWLIWEILFAEIGNFDTSRNRGTGARFSNGCIHSNSFLDYSVTRRRNHSPKLAISRSEVTAPKGRDSVWGGRPFAFLW